MTTGKIEIGLKTKRNESLSPRGVFHMLYGNSCGVWDRSGYDCSGNRHTTADRSAGLDGGGIFCGDRLRCLDCW